jgi:hypothetical protein
VYGKKAWVVGATVKKKGKGDMASESKVERNKTDEFSSQSTNYHSQ